MRLFPFHRDSVGAGLRTTRLLARGEAMNKNIVTRVFAVLSLFTLGACSTMRETRMVAAADYTASKRVYVVATPTPLLAGPDTVRTTSPDGSTIFVCANGSQRDASRVAPGEKPCL